MPSSPMAYNGRHWTVCRQGAGTVSGSGGVSSRVTSASSHEGVASCGSSASQRACSSALSAAACSRLPHSPTKRSPCLPGGSGDGTCHGARGRGRWRLPEACARPKLQLLVAVPACGWGESRARHSRGEGSQAGDRALSSPKEGGPLLRTRFGCGLPNLESLATARKVHRPSAGGRAPEAKRHRCRGRGGRASLSASLPAVSAPPQGGSHGAAGAAS